MKKRTALILAALLLLVGVGYLAWTLSGLPPVKYYLRYGLDPYCEPTGERVTYEGVEFVEIGPGIFRMGSDYEARDGDWLGSLCAPVGLPWGRHPRPSSEMPVHWVEFRRGFWIARTEVTNAQYERFDERHPRHRDSGGDDTPVVDVSWDDAKNYCSWLAEKASRPIRLPSDAEWECACRAGSRGEFAFGDKEEVLAEYAWIDGNSESRAQTVATKRPNRWGLSDLHGNVWEWCEDTTHGGYEGAPTDGSAWTEGCGVARGMPWRVLRGGGWLSPARHCRSAHRFGYLQPVRAGWLGFRPAFSTPEPE